MAFTEKPPILQGSTQDQLRAIRDYLFRMASSLEAAATAPAVGTGATVRRTRADGTAVTEPGSAAKADTDAIRKSAAELRSLIIKHANDLQDQIDTIELTTFYVKYADAFTGDYPADMYNSPKASTEYMGVCSSASTTAPTSPAAYTWSKIKGNQGERGIPGQPGTNGQTTYLHIKYSDDGETFTVNPETGEHDGETPGAFIGMYSDFEELDSAVFADYEWHRFADDEELKSMINDKETYLLNYIDSKDETYRGLFLAQSDFGTWERSLDSRIQTSAQGVVESYGFQESISSTRREVEEYFTQMDGQIRRGFIENPDYPDNSSDEFIFGIAISSKLQFTTELPKSDGTYEYYHLESGQTFGFYTAEGWQFWVDGNKRGYYNSLDQKLHVKDIVADDSLQIGTDWQIKAFPDSQELEFVYVGGGET